jgi:hypothetical protein
VNNQKLFGYLVFLISVGIFFLATATMDMDWIICQSKAGYMINNDWWWFIPNIFGMNYWLAYYVTVLRFIFGSIFIGVGLTAFYFRFVGHNSLPTIVS